MSTPDSAVKTPTKTATNNEPLWFVLRDLKRANSKSPAYKVLAEEGFEVYTPMQTRIAERNGKRIKETVPVIRDLVFIHTTRELLDPLIKKTPTLQYRYVKGMPQGTPMIVPTQQMETFIGAISNFSNPQYLRPEDITQSMIGAKIRIISNGVMNNREGHLLKVVGSRKKRMLVSIPELLVAAVEITSADYIEVIEEN